MRTFTPKLFTVGAALAALPLVLAFHRAPRVDASPKASPPANEATSVVEAADAFMATLTADQKTKLQTEMNQASVQKWSNLPVSPGSRNGLQFTAMNPAQAAAALKLARVALGEEGFARMQEIRSTDDLLAKNDRGGPGGPPGGGFGGPPPDFDAARDVGQNGGQGDTGPFSSGPKAQGGRQRGQDGPGQGGFGGPGGPGGGMGYGAGTYSIAFLNKPSATEPWMLQIGGHHLAFNIYYKGSTVTATPHFLGVEPTTWKDAAGKEHEPLKPMKDAMYGLVNSLTPEQKTQAHLDQRFSDVYLGPRRNGRFPSDIVGVPVASLSPASQAFVKKAIEAWTGDVAQAADYRKLYFSELAQTKVAYSGDTDFEHQGDYVRIDGPHVWIEFACQDGIVYRGRIHYHTVWRDRKTDYGVSYAF